MGRSSMERLKRRGKALRWRRSIPCIFDMCLLRGRGPAGRGRRALPLAVAISKVVPRGREAGWAG